MRKIKTLFKIDPITYLLTKEVVEGSEWVINGEGFPTEKFNGTACMVRDGKLYRRYDQKNGKTAPVGWEPCENEPNTNGHWPGWVPVKDDDPQDQWHIEAFDNISTCPFGDDEMCYIDGQWIDGTYELVGPKVQGNPYNLDKHELWIHYDHILDDPDWPWGNVPRSFLELKEYLILANDTPRSVQCCPSFKYFEGIVWHRENGDMVKIRLKDYIGGR